MTLEPNQQEKVLQWMRQKELHRNCPSCGASEDFMCCDIVELHVKSNTGERSGTEIPVLPLICPNCGHVRIFSAKLIRIVE